MVSRSMIAVAVKYPRWLRPVLSRSSASLRCGSLISLIVKPFLGNMGDGPVGMKCQWNRSSEANANAPSARCCGVKLASSFVAAPAMFADERSAATIEPPASAATRAAARYRRGEKGVFIGRILA